MTTISPLNLFQERYAADPWRLLCCVIMLNLCSGRALENIHEEFFRRWPTPYSLITEDPGKIEELISYLGLQRRRTTALRRMSVTYAFLWDGRDPKDLPGIGKYGSDSFRIFVRGEFSVEPTDKELRKYLEWQKNKIR